MKRRSLAIAAAAALLAFATPALACSVLEGTPATSSLEMTRNADVILIGVVEHVPRLTEDDDLDEPRMIVRRVEVLKGGPLPRRIRVPGWLAEGEARIRSDPDDLSSPHPEAGMGLCNRASFIPNSRVLFFLASEAGRFRPAASLYSRWAEDVPRRRSLWVATVQNFVEITSLPEDEWGAAIIQRRDALAARTEDRAAIAIAAELNGQLEELDHPGWIRPPADYDFPADVPQPPPGQ